MPSPSAPTQTRPAAKARAIKPTAAMKVATAVPLPASAELAPAAPPQKSLKVRSARKKSSRREDARRRIRERLISAALTAFAEQGYAGTTIERIVELADTTAPTFYRHFPSKRDMLEPLREHLTAEVRAVFRLLDTTKPQTPNSIKLWLRDYIEMWRRQRKLCEAHWEAVAADSGFGAGTMSVSLLIADDLKKLLAQFPGGLAEMVRLRLAMIMVLLDRVVHLARDEPDETLSEMILSQFAEMFWLSIYSDSARAYMNAEVTNGERGARKTSAGGSLTGLLKR